MTRSRRQVAYDVLSSPITYGLFVWLIWFTVLMAVMSFGAAKGKKGPTGANVRGPAVRGGAGATQYSVGS